MCLINCHCAPPLHYSSTSHCVSQGVIGGPATKGRGSLSQGRGPVADGGQVQVAGWGCACSQKHSRSGLSGDINIMQTLMCLCSIHAGLCLSSVFLSRLTQTVRRSGWLLSSWSLRITSMKEPVDCWPRLAAVPQQQGWVCACVWVEKKEISLFQALRRIQYKKRVDIHTTDLPLSPHFGFDISVFIYIGVCWVLIKTKMRC